MKKVALLLMLLLLVNVPVLAADVTITHLTYTHHGDGYHQYLQEMANKFEEQNPGAKIDLIIGLQDKFQTMIAGGIAPDVMDLPDFAHLGPQGYFVDVKPLMERDGLAHAFNPQVMKGMQAPNGAIYNTPIEIGLYVTFFNRDLFDKAGLQTPEKLGLNWNWDTLISSGKKLTVDADGNGEPETFGFDRAWGPGWRIMVLQAGGKFYEFDDQMNPVKSLWNTPEVAAGIEENARVYREGITPHLRVADQGKFHFLSGGTAVSMQDGVGITGKGLKEVNFDWDMSLLPAGPKGPIGMGGGSGPYLMSSSQNVELSWKWIKFITADKENVEAFARLTGRLPALNSAQPAYALVNGITDKNYQAIFEQTNYLPPADAGYPVPLNLNARKVNLNKIWSGEVPVTTYLESIHEQKTAIIEEMKEQR